MDFDEKDYLLLSFVSTFDKPRQFTYGELPPDIKTNFVNMPMDHKDNIHGRLLAMSRYSLLDRNARSYKINDAGRAKLIEYKNKKEKTETIVDNQLSVVELQIKDLTKKIEDYPLMEKRATLAEKNSTIAAVAAVIAAILSLLQWICSRPD